MTSSFSKTNSLFSPLTGCLSPKLTGRNSSCKGSQASILRTDFFFPRFLLSCCGDVLASMATIYTMCTSLHAWLFLQTSPEIYSMPEVLVCTSNISAILRLYESEKFLQTIFPSTPYSLLPYQTPSGM